MKKIINITAGFALYIVCAILFMGYGHTETHPMLNDIIVLKFLEKVSTGAFANKDKFKNYEFNWNNTEQPSLTGPAIDKDFYLWYSASDEVDKTFTPMKWISEGGWMEDEPWGPASICHFYDPLGLDNGKKYLTDCSGILESHPVLNALKVYNSRDALTWAKSDPDHQYNWKNGKNFIIEALKEKDADKRKRLMAQAYRCLGQVMHLVCDMGCTPHVRNDSHPPNFFLPVGLIYDHIVYWKVIGDPDPYEDLCKKIDVYSIWQLKPPNKNFVDDISSLEKFEDIFDKMARFTNERFFSGQTIVTDRYKPAPTIVNLLPDFYPSPFLTEAEYNKSDYTYYMNYDGVTVKMCKDKVPIWFQSLFGNDSTRGRPYLDYECVKSIASAIYPNLAEAGANVIKIFIPSLKIDIKEAKADSGGIIRGEITYTIPSINDEYSGLFDLNNIYNGPVSLFINNTDTKITAEATKNKFEFKLNGKIQNLKKDDLAVTKIEFGGIVLKSDSKKLSSTGPVITSLYPTKGNTGDRITISGTNFGTDKTKGEVHFAGAIVYNQSIISWSDNQIKVDVPELAVSGNLKIKVNQDYSNELYFGVPPIITSLSKTSGSIGDEVTILGYKFGNSKSNGSVEFDGAICTEITNWSDTQLNVKVPDNATSGDVVVKVKGETSNKISFQVLGPQITSITPSTAKVGDLITINGTAFGDDKTKGEVYFNDKKATEISYWTNTAISLKIPAGAETGNVVVRVNGVQSNLYYYTVTSNVPQITSITPDKQVAGQWIVIYGNNFGYSKNEGDVELNGVIIPDDYIAGWSEDHISMRVPFNVKSGNMYIIVNGIRSEGYYFKVRTFYYRRTEIKVENIDAPGQEGYVVSSTFGDNYAEFSQDFYLQYSEYNGKNTVKGTWTIPPEKFNVTDTVKIDLTASLISNEGNCPYALYTGVFFGKHLGQAAIHSSGYEKVYSDTTILITRGNYATMSDPFYMSTISIIITVDPYFIYLGDGRVTYIYELKEE